MDSSILKAGVLRALAAGCVAGQLFVGPASAEPETPAPEDGAETAAPAEDVDPDESFAKSLLGKTYSGELDLEGWTDFGGGLVSPPIYVNLYHREDETSLVLTSKLSAKTFTVIDAMIVSKPWKGYAISIACTRGDDFTLRFIGDTRGPEGAEWWTEVRRAWEIAVPPEPEPEAEEGAEAEAEPKSEAETEAEAEPKIEPGKIAETSSKGVKCTNPNW